MPGLRSMSLSLRSMSALVLALILALRLLTPAGFMPAFDRGAVTIVICPDAEPALPPMTGHHHHDHSKKLHQPCPYASASSLGAATADLPLLAAVPVAGLVLLIGRPFAFLERRRAHELPRPRGPPLPA